MDKTMEMISRMNRNALRNEEILSELHAAGFKIYKQKLSQIFSNPFYCGLIANKMLNEKLVEGTHERLISNRMDF